MDPGQWFYAIFISAVGCGIIVRAAQRLQFGRRRHKRFSGWVLPGSREWRRRAVDRKWQREEDRNETCRRNAKDALDNLLRTHEQKLAKLRTARQAELSGWQNEFNQVLWSDQARRDAENARLSALSDQTSFVYMGIQSDSERFDHLPDWRDRLAARRRMRVEEDDGIEFDDSIQLMSDGVVLKNIYPNMRNNQQRKRPNSHL